MTAVAGTAFQLGHGAVLRTVTCECRFSIFMARKTDASGLFLEQVGVVSAVGPVTVQAVAVSKGDMRSLARHLRSKVLVAAQTKLSLLQTFLEQSLPLAAMGVMAGAALPAAERLMGTVAAQLDPDLRMAGDTEGSLRLRQQASQFGIMGHVAVSAASFAGRGMAPRQVGIFLPVVAGET